MKKAIKTICFFIALFFSVPGAVGQDNLTLVLKNGSQYKGFVSRQQPGKNLSFTSSDANIYLPDSMVTSITDIEVPIATLSPEWVKWAEENDAFKGEGDKRTLTLSNITGPGNNISQVRVIERGAKTRYIDLSPKIYKIRWEDIEVIRGERRPKLLLSGVDRRYLLDSNKTYEGQYIEEVPGKTVSLLTPEGIIQVVNTSEIVKDTRVKLNPNQSLLEQSDLIDVVTLKDDATPLRGIIFERNYSKTGSKKDSYFCLLNEKGEIVTCLNSDVVEYGKEKNPGYKPLTDLVLGKDQGAVNRMVETLRPVREKDGVLYVPIDSLNICLNREHNQRISAEFSVDNSSAHQFRLVKLMKYVDKKAKKEYYGFTYESLHKSGLIPSEVATTVNGVSGMVFTIPSPTSGYYIVFDPISNKALPFKIEDAK